MTNKHTPGPWTVFESKGGPVIEAPGSEPSSRVMVCRIHETAIRKDQEDRAEHDARLIAAAPELLEALKQALKHAEKLFAASDSMDGLIDSRVNLEYDIEQAQSAIAKAKGTR